MDLEKGNDLIPAIRGLRDVCNTCWFNSILQCLKQTSTLSQLIKENARIGQTFVLPGGKLISDDASSVLLPPLEYKIGKPKYLTYFLNTTLIDLDDEKETAYKPRVLYALVIKFLPQFKATYQLDAYEFFKSFLEALRIENIRRHQTAILETMQLTPKTNPLSVKNDQRRIIRFYGLQIQDALKSSTEEVFCGSLKNILMCQCMKASHQDESFFDLSLRIPETGSQPVKLDKDIKHAGELQKCAYDADDEEDSQNTLINKKASQDLKKNGSEDLECTVELCLRNFFAIKVRPNDDKGPKCDECANKGEKLYTQLKICNPPLVLVLNFKRFKCVHRRIYKNSTFIKFSSLLDMTSFCSTEYLNASNQSKVLYSLYAVVKHSGRSPCRGRYVSYVKESTNQKGTQKDEVPESKETIPDKWYYANNTLVEEISESDVLKTQAYILFYERIF